MRIFAASSLTEVLPPIVERYREQRPSVEFDLNFAGSQTLATQIEEGAPADLFISANPVQAERLLAAGLAERPAVIAENRLIVAVREDAPWRTLEAAAEAGVQVAVGAPGVPVGALTVTALELLAPEVAAALREQVVTEDPNVRVVLSRVELGEADAAFVYRTDLSAARGVRALELPEAVPSNQYVAVLVVDRRVGDIDHAAAFLDFLGGEQATALLRAAGFLPPGTGADEGGGGS